MRARPGWTGFNGCLLVSKTKTLLKMSLPFGVMVALTMFVKGLTCKTLG